jgi:putative colanic acid biosynthesis acetyltransferase WcaF
MLELRHEIERLRTLVGVGFRARNLTRFTLTWLKWRLRGLHAPELAYIDPRARLSPPGNVTLGASCLIGNAYLYALAPISIGAHVIVNDGAFLCTGSHDHSNADFTLIARPIHVGDHAWIATNATLMPGVTLGRGAVVAAESVVTRDVPEMTIVGGNPAREIGKRDAVHEDWVTSHLGSTDPWRALTNRAER